jgi:O-antigen/teichoic acid export membrane protein
MGRLFRAGSRAVFLVQAPLVFAVICFAPEILRVWLGHAFEVRSTDVLRWLMLGVLINSLAMLPFTLLQGIGRADVTAKLHLAELPFYLALLVLLIQHFGIEGAAIAWCTRVTADLVALIWFCARLTGESAWELFPSPGLLTALVAFLGVGALSTTVLQKVLVTACFVATFVGALWAWRRDESLTPLLRRSPPKAADGASLPEAPARR